ncbi:MAG: DUF2058 domain-containing protein [Gammaproteobacteria bacterium]|nr:DUF2058 domain-containing protein [Gammaproteobacteria bacterium]MCP5418266.1 DUF2058 domain-containing protein [Chromatiaceae bacterium]
MIKSLQEQLISSGLVDKKRAKRIQTEQQKSNRKERRSGLPQDSQLAFQKASKERAERDKELNRQRQLLSEQKAVAAQISQLVQANRLPKEVDGDSVFNFVVKGKIKKIRVHPNTREQIGAGKLAIVSCDGEYSLVPASLVQKLRQRSETCVVFYNDPEVKDITENDEYPEYKVPDDLMW